MFVHILYWLLSLVIVAFGVIVLARKAIIVRLGQFNRLKASDPGQVSARWAWAIQEGTVLVSVGLTLYVQWERVSWGSLLYLAPLVAHYAYRTFVYPMSLSHSTKVPSIYFYQAIAFCAINGVAQALASLFEPVFTFNTIALRALGIILFVSGFLIHYRHDQILNRKASQTKRDAQGLKIYELPSEAMFRYMVCPNYFGEILEWTGFAIYNDFRAAAAAFAFFTYANLQVRALQKYDDYGRKDLASVRNKTPMNPYFAIRAVVAKLLQTTKHE